MKSLKKQKQVKSFNVDGRVYDWLVEKIRESGSNISISELVNDYLGFLYYELRSILDYYEREKIRVDLPWVINKLVSESKFFPPKLDILYADPDMKKWMETEIHSRAMEILEQYQKEQKLVMNNIRERKAKRGFEGLGKKIPKTKRSQG
ncbi:MAG: hypothetical protein Q8M71_05735 [Thermodesulfovibrionales bacterium]|nr:hypothetical protein [Thermodesulfovibrionales bacterium]